MRSALLFFIGLFLLAGGIVSNAQPHSQQESEAVSEDSLVDVIGYFSKNDTLIYRITDTEWKLAPSDTVKVASSVFKAMLTVTDSTSSGYKLKYEIIDAYLDSVTEANLGLIDGVITRSLCEKMVGITINFETNEFGEMTKINNIDEINQHAKSLYGYAMEEFMKIPEIAGLKDSDFDIESMLQEFDSEKLIEGYFEELKILFQYHGASYEIGESHIHNDATQTEYESEEYFYVDYDRDDNSYLILSEYAMKIPPSTLKDAINGLMKYNKNDSVSDSFNNYLDSQIDGYAINRTITNVYFMSTGWPYKAIVQKARILSGQGVIDQKNIYLDYINY